MNTKTSLTVIGIIAVAIIIFFIVKSKNPSTNTLPSGNDSGSMDDSTTKNPNEATPGKPNVIDPNSPVNPAFPTTGFEPAN